MVQRTSTGGALRNIPDIYSQKNNTPTGPSQAELLLRVTSGIAAELIRAYDTNESVSLNEIRAKLSKKHGFGGVPRLVDIISAIPDDYKKALLPKLKARPVRTASGVSSTSF
jgi:elongator complex protein 3